MCYHFADTDTQDYIDWYVGTHNLKKWVHQGVRYYINGFSHAPCVAHKQGANELAALEWGLIPFWIKSEEEGKKLSNQTLNAKSETVFNLPSFRGSIKTKKCLIFAKGFFEWRHIDDKNKIPYLIGVKDNVIGDNFVPFTFGGIYDTWVNKDTGEVKETFAIITTPANSMMATIHNSKMRMPLIVPEESQAEWLSTTDPERIKQLMQPFPADRMLAHPVSKLVSSAKSERNVPEVLEAEDYEEVSMDEFL